MYNQTKTYYNQKVEEVLKYINNHLDQNLSIKELADYSGISFFHFHRILKAALNEPLAGYINRVRLETAVNLNRYSDQQLSDIAIRIGYNDLSSFSKAFSKEFGLSPKDFKSDKNIILNTNVDYSINKKGEIKTDIKPKIINLPEKQVLYISVKGAYGGKEVAKSWDKLYNFITDNKLISWNPDLFSIYYDDPDVVGANNCRSDLCFVTRKKFPTNDIFRSKTIKGGKYAVFRYKGSYDFLWTVYETIYSSWILNTDAKLRDYPVIERYMNYSAKAKPENNTTDIYIPIE